MFSVSAKPQSLCMLVFNVASKFSLIIWPEFVALQPAHLHLQSAPDICRTYAWPKDDLTAIVYDIKK